MKSITAMELQESSSLDLGSKVSSCNLVRLQLLSGNCRELTNPKLGREFLAGTFEDGTSLGFFRRGILRSVEFALDPSLGSELLQFTRRTIGELLASQKFPTEARLGFIDNGQAVQRIRLVGVARGFLFTDYHQNPAIPIASLGMIELDCG